MEEGRRQLAASAGFGRLVTVALHREQRYEGMASIQAELSGKVMELAPPGLPARQQVSPLTGLSHSPVPNTDTHTQKGRPKNLRASGPIFPPLTSPISSVCSFLPQLPKPPL